MNVLRILVAVAVLVVPASVSAQQVQLRMESGRVSLDVRNVPVVQILREWARIGGVNIVNAEKVVASPVTLQLVDVPEREALNILLRGVAGYMLGVRTSAAKGASQYDRILILPTSSAPRNPPPVVAAASQPPRFIPPQSDNGQDSGPDPTVGGIRRIAPPIIRPLVPATSSAETPQDEGPTPSAATPPTSANPFGMPTGSGLPGAITPPAGQQPQQAPTRR
jgi:hypothetical protein